MKKCMKEGFAMPVPVYIQIKQSILDKVKKEEYRPGTCLPSEHDFCSLFNTSRMTVRRAIDELCYEGVLYRIQGKGTFVRKVQFDKSLSLLAGYSEEMEQAGKTPASKLLERELVKADAKLANVLQVALGTKLVMLKRLRSSNGEPLVLEKTWYPALMCGFLLNENLENASVYNALKKNGIQLHRASQYVEAVMPHKEEAKWLEISEKCPCLLVVRQSFDETGKVAEYAKSIYSGPKARLYSQLGPAR